MTFPRQSLVFGLGLAVITALAVVNWPQETQVADSHAQAAAPSCSPHGIDASLCWICDPQLRDAGRLWCSEHERYEDRCWICHPDLRDADRLYCEKHGLYEDECVACRPALTNTPTEIPEAATELWCTEHELAEAECGICHPELADGLTPGGGLKIRLPSADSARLSGVASNRPVSLEATSAVEAIGEVGYDENRLARVTPLVEGVVRQVHVDLGDVVSTGEPLVTLSSPAVAEARAELQAAVAAEDAARRALQREAELHERGVSAERDLVDARSALAAVEARRRALEQNLGDLGIASEDLAAMARGERAGSTLDLVAPFEGTVVDRSAVVGDVVRLGDELIRLADIREMWVTVSVPEHELGLVATGQAVEVHSTATGARTRGTVTWVSSHLDAGTRMARVRAAIPNPAGHWKAGMFVDAQVAVGAVGTALSVPRSAVHRFGGEPFVFVDLGDGLYEVRRVQLASLPGRSAGDRAVVRAGLVGEEQVVTARSFLVKSEFQKSRLGAGCVD